MQFRMLRFHGERLADIALAEPELTENDPSVSTFKEEGVMARLDVQGLSYRYAEGEPWVLHDCSFTVEEGESLAIVGATGCGKTTLLKLLLGLLAPTRGSVAINGWNIERLGTRHYHAMVGAVMQDDHLFTGSIAENIAFGEAAWDLERVQEAARLAAVHDDIQAMPVGYHSLICGIGTALPGDQRQRVLLARALYRKPTILFLDEATSHLAIERERAVNEAVSHLSITRVLVAHRPETIASADRVLVLYGGQLVQELHPEKAVAHLNDAETA